MLIKIENKKQNKFILSEKLYIGITDTINGFRSTLACCEGVSPSKRSRRSNDNGSAAVGGSAVGGGSAATPDTAGNTKKVATISPLSAALVLKVTFIESLPIASRPFLTPLAESALREFACLFYAEEKVKETKSNPNYFSTFRLSRNMNLL